MEENTQRDRTFSFKDYIEGFETDSYWDENETLTYEPFTIHPFIKVKPQDDFLETILREHNNDELNIKIPTKSEEYHKGLAECKYNDFYKKPFEVSKSAFKIWEEAGLDDEECYCQIQMRLVVWVNNNAVISNKNNTTYISWKCKHTSTLYNSSWNTFIKWFLCCCN